MLNFLFLLRYKKGSVIINISGLVIKFKAISKSLLSDLDKVFISLFK